MCECSILQISLLVFFVPIATADLASEYNHAAYLDPEENYKLYWSVKDADKSIHFAAEVKTLGWVGFGISAGLSGNMKSADMAVGWVDSRGQGHLQDYHGEETRNGMPLLDKSQDYDFVGSSESKNVTVLKFKRKLATCDKEDRDIPLGTTKVIYAFGKDDVFKYHSVNRGARSLNLLNYVKNAPPPKTAKHFDLVLKDVLVPTIRTTYWCQAIKLADVVTLTQKQHVIEIEPIIEMKDRGVVHHIVVYVCKDSFNETHLNISGSCYGNRNMPPAIKECAGSSPMYAWAVGGVNFKYPSHVGWPIGAMDSMKYVVLETHFDNPTKRSDWIVSSGLRFYYDTPRKYDAGTLSVGASAGPSIVIPPKQENWIISGACTKSCSSKLNESKLLPGGEIKLFASFPHAHTAGRGIWTKLLRNGKEITEIIRDDNYDFDYQQTHLLTKEISFFKGDEIINYCRYNTMGRKDAVRGGLSTYDEMCLNFIIYYPKADLSLCITGERKVHLEFLQKYGNVGRSKNTTYFKNWVGVKWNKTMVDELKSLYSYEGNDTIFSACVIGPDKRMYVTVESRPTVEVPLGPRRDVCTAGISHASALNLSGFTISFMVCFAIFWLTNV